ncbi:hypothetical protein PR202_ga02246 [Eleusine coracana subsp. coracana]|uniref:Secreted protein n=1 Tax=Eleusine coracana subsp. coracana TaxID=191504 RepID=A0AAV5BKF1_ELECO|nr:hypothetical protein PR202_ga02246 [Eleusine coracana subsp. coracana]
MRKTTTVALVILLELMVVHRSVRRWPTPSTPRHELQRPVAPAPKIQVAPASAASSSGGSLPLARLDLALTMSLLPPRVRRRSSQARAELDCAAVYACWSSWSKGKERTGRGEVTVSP